MEPITVRLRYGVRGSRESYSLVKAYSGGAEDAECALNQARSFAAEGLELRAAGRADWWRVDTFYGLRLVGTIC